MIRVKDEDGVSLDRLDPELWAMVPAFDECYARHGIPEFWITSGTERTTSHKGRPVVGGIEDPHYEGKAIDGRIQNCPLARRQALVDDLEALLGPGFVVLWEYRGTPREHVHIQKGHVAPAIA